jgi:NAD(P)-dependent dehydrogenase (short-subunit alcohol dehydrogenase family)
MRAAGWDRVIGIDKDAFDLTSEGQREAAVEQALAAMPEINALIVADRAPVGAQLAFAQAVAARMNSGSAIVFFSSIYGIAGADRRIYMGADVEPCPPEYAADKGAIVALTRHLACAWARLGIRVNCISPGGVYSGQDAGFVARYSERVPMARMARADEIAKAAIFLASDAASYITGHNLVVDGGLTAW